MVDAPSHDLPTRVALTQSVDSTPTLDERPEALVVGRTLGRYVMLRRIGAGGLGVVYEAFDPELDRKVAIKLLHQRSGMDGSEGRSQLVREAQALAKLAHPNVVTIHDVGTRDRDVWLAMELVDGQTLREWFQERSRSWREVVSIMSAAGRGLAAALGGGRCGPRVGRIGGLRLEVGGGAGRLG